VRIIWLNAPTVPTDLNAGWGIVVAVADLSNRSIFGDRSGYSPVRCPTAT